MKKFSLSILLLFPGIQQNFAQQNCSNPIPVTICPSTYLPNQTNAGQVDDATSSCNIPGEDLVYGINAPNGASALFVSIVNASGPMLLYLETGTCGTGMCSSIAVPAGDTNLIFNVTSATNYYLWVDAANTVTFDISFGADTGSIFVNIPNTQGNLQFDISGCAAPMFSASKPFFQVSYNGIYQTNPMTLAPLFVNGTLCIVTYFENTSGIEGIKKFDFHFNSGGYTAVSASPPIVSGFYNAGDWIASNVGNDWSFEFNDALGLGQGDFFLFPNTCLRYEFCFNVTPLSNDPLLTSVDMNATSDGFGAAFNGVLNSGCCPGPFPDCLLGGGGGASSSAHSFGFSFADPGSPLPIVLLEFNAHANNESVEVDWITQSELNNDFFTLQKSINGYEWTTVCRKDAAGNSTSPLTYHFTDLQPYPGTSYYRLRQTDFDGTTSYSSAVSVKIHSAQDISVYPNPTNGDVTIQGLENLSSAQQTSSAEITVSSIVGEQFTVPVKTQGREIHLDLSLLKSGIYFLEIKGNEKKFYQKIILQNHE